MLLLWCRHSGNSNDDANIIISIDIISMISNDNDNNSWSLLDQLWEGRKGLAASEDLLGSSVRVRSAGEPEAGHTCFLTQGLCAHDTEGTFWLKSLSL